MTLAKTLIEDVLTAYRTKSPYGRRQCIRAVFAAVEGILSLLKRDLKHAHFKLSSAEMAVLNDETYGTDDKGLVKVRRLLLTLRDNIRFTVQLIRKLHPEYAVDYSGNGWQSLMASLEVRNRLMHPKLDTDLEVSDDDLQQAIDGLLWFIDLNKDGQLALEQFFETPEAKSQLLAKAVKEYMEKNKGRKLGGFGQLVEPESPNAWPISESVSKDFPEQE